MHRAKLSPVREAGKRTALQNRPNRGNKGIHELWGIYYAADHSGGVRPELRRCANCGGDGVNGFVVPPGNVTPDAFTITDKGDDATGLIRADGRERFHFDGGAGNDSLLITGST